MFLCAVSLFYIANCSIMAIADYFMCVLVLLGIANIIFEYQLFSGTYRYNTENPF